MASHRLLRVAIALAVAFAVFAFADGPAHACSCATPEPRDALHEADGAFVGALVAKDNVDDQRAIYTFEVETAVKAALGATVEVHSAAYGAACGFEVRFGQRVGVLLQQQRDGDWTGGLCSEIDPDELLEAAAPLPLPDGAGPVRTLVGGNFGEVRIVALDADGRTLAYGEGDGDVVAIATCPGMHRAVESVAEPRLASIAVRDTGSLDLVRSVALVEGRWPRIDEVACLTADGSVVAASVVRRGVTSVFVIRGSHVRRAYDAAHARVWFQGDRAYLQRAGRVAPLGLWGGPGPPLTTLPRGLTGVEVSRDERHVAGIMPGSRSRDERPRLTVVRASDGRIRSFTLDGWSARGQVRWLDNTRVAYLPAWSGSARAHELRLPELARIGGFRGWRPITSFVHRGCAGGVGWGDLYRACFPDGPVSRSVLVGRETWAAVPVSGRIEAETSA